MKKVTKSTENILFRNRSTLAHQNKLYNTEVIGNDQDEHEGDEDESGDEENESDDENLDPVVIRNGEPVAA